jgi:hypothetical protein
MRSKFKGFLPLFGGRKKVPRKSTLRDVSWRVGVDTPVGFTAAEQPVAVLAFAEGLPCGIDSLSLKSRKAVIKKLRVLGDLEKNADESDIEDQEQPTDIRGARDRRDASDGQKTKRQLTAASCASDDQGDVQILLPDNWLDPTVGGPHVSQIKRDRVCAERGEAAQEIGH